MGSRAVHPEVIRTQVTELLGVGVEAWSAPASAAGAEALPVAESAAPHAGATNEAFPWASIQYGLWLGRHDEHQLRGVGNCPGWVTDELWLGSRGNARGYRGSPNPTADRFVEHGGRVRYRAALAAAAERAKPAALTGIRGVG